MRRTSITLSAIFHGLVVVIAVAGLPFLTRHEFVVPPPVVVDFIEISKVTETDKMAPKPVEKPEEKPLPPAAAKNTASEAVAPVPQEPPKPEEKKEIKKETKAAPVVDPNAPPDKTKKAKKEEAKKEPQKDFSSVLKNLIDPKTQQESQADAPDKKTAPAPGQNAPLGPKLTMSEEDALRSQLEKCWNVPFGAKDVENMSVDIFMVINPDRTLREARVVDMSRYNSDSFFRAAADSALRAVRSSLCSPFNVPPDKYDTWNNVTVTFNPKDMF